MGIKHANLTFKLLAAKSIGMTEQKVITFIHTRNITPERASEALTQIDELVKDFMMELVDMNFEYSVEKHLEQVTDNLESVIVGHLSWIINT